MNQPYIKLPFTFLSFTINIHSLPSVMCNRRCEGLLGVALRSGTLSLFFPLSLQHHQHSLPSQPGHTDPDLFDTDLPPQFQYTDRSSSTNCPLHKTLAAASQYFESSVHCFLLFCKALMINRLPKHGNTSVVQVLTT